MLASAQELAALAKGAPPPRVEIDQVHCTVETKLRRVLLMHEVGALDGRRVLLLGDDDLTAARARARLLGGGRGIRGLVVVDVDAACSRFV